MSTATVEWSIHDLAKAAAVTTRTLRHYDELGLLKPSRIGANGYRHYDQDGLVRLQRILLLRELGLGLPAIAEVLAGEQRVTDALGRHLEVLHAELSRLQRRIESVRNTLRRTEAGEQLMAAEVFDGFDHTQYKDEVVERWGTDAYHSADSWWRSLSAEDKQDFQQRQLDIAADYGAAKRTGLTADDERVQAIAQRQYEWLKLCWRGREPGAATFAGLGEMYASDPRFGQNYDRHGEGVAAFVRDAMRSYAERNLS